MAEHAVRVHAVVVTFEPDAPALLRLLRALAPQVELVHVVDNSEAAGAAVASLARRQDLPGVELHALGRNTGIAHAINVGCAASAEAGATHVLLSDQDSVPGQGMVAELLAAIARAEAAGARVGAAGPTYRDRHTGATYPFQVDRPGRLFYGHRAADPAHPQIEVLTLITSGTLIGLDALRRVGPMREDLFIDFVDTEWCHRARAAGYTLLGVHAATMEHGMGDRALRVWYFGWRRESAYGPTRVYYRMRNFVAVCRMRQVSLRWKLRAAWYWIGFVYAQAVFGEQRAAVLRMALRGLADGVAGRFGRLAD